MHPNQNYRIGTDILPNGTVRARAHGRKTNTRTFPKGTTPQQAARHLAMHLERDRFADVRLHSSDGGGKADWTVWVHDTVPTYAEAITSPTAQWGERFTTSDGVTLQWTHDMADGGASGYAQVDE